jgi:molybdate transport system substrate-binding protein
MSESLHILCAGAVQGIVKALHERFTAETGAAMAARFGAVGAMKEALLGGEPCDVMIATDAMVVALQSSGDLGMRPRAPLGSVRTGVAVAAGRRAPDIATPDALRAALLDASAIYFPDPQRSTAGIHFVSVLRQLGIDQAVAARLRTFPNGASAMRELGADKSGRAIGCTQITEIRYTPGIELVGALPKAFELATVYTAAAASRAAQPVLAQRFVELLAGPASLALRRQGGFEFSHNAAETP